MISWKYWCEGVHPTIRSRWMNDGGYMAGVSNTFSLSIQTKHDDEEVKTTRFIPALANFRWISSHYSIIYFHSPHRESDHSAILSNHCAMKLGSFLVTTSEKQNYFQDFYWFFSRLTFTKEQLLAFTDPPLYYGVRFHYWFFYIF